MTFAGEVVQAAIRDRYEAADAFCLPSISEGLPVVLMEAMASELPVIATRIMGVPELVEDGVSGILVTPGRPEALADAIEQLAASAPEQRQRMGTAARARVEEEFGVDAAARTLQAAFATAISAAAPHRTG